MYMLDTNICIYVLKNHPRILLNQFQSYVDELSVSTIVYAELMYGIELSPKKIKQARLNQLIDFFSLLKIIDWDQNAANEYARLRAFLKNNGSIIGNMDMLIAAHAISTNSTIITNNTKEFARIPSLKLGNWLV